MAETSFLSDDEIILAEFVDESSSSLATLDTLFVELEKAPSDDMIVNAIFRPIHSLKANSAFLGLMSLKTLSHAMESLLDAMRKKELAVSKPLISVLLQGVDELKAITERVRQKQPEIADAAGFRLLMERVTAVKTGQPLPAAVPVAAAETKAKPASDVSAAEAATMVRVPTAALDALAAVAGELSGIHAEVGSLADTCKTAPPVADFGKRIPAVRDRLGKVLEQFKDSLGTMRKEPIQNLLQKAPRIIRDLLAANGKKVSLSIRGGHILAGRQVIQALDAPLVHLVRNAVDHGAELPDERVKAGKPAECALVIQVNELPGELIIKISDDGKGIDFRALLMKAIKMGVFKGDQQPTPNDIANLIFHPGLSTAKQVTDVSGRGFGMDIVKESVQKLGGKIEVFSKPGKGTDFLIVVPNP